MSPKPKASDFTIDRFHSSGQQLCKLLGIKESFNMWKEFNSHRIFFLYTNMAVDPLFCTQIWPPWRHVKTISRVMHRVFTNWLTGSPGECGTQQGFICMGRLRHKVQPRSLYKPFMTRKEPLSYTFQWQMMPLSHTYQRATHPLYLL